MEGYQTLRQLGFGLLDMAYHIKSEEVKDIKSFEDVQTKSYTIISCKSGNSN